MIYHRSEVDKRKQQYISGFATHPEYVKLNVPSEGDIYKMNNYIDTYKLHYK